MPSHFLPAAALLLLSAAPASDTLRPGLWKMTIAMNVSGAAGGGEAAQSPGDGGVGRSACLGRGMTIDRMFSEQLENCTIRDPVAKNGHISFRAICAPDEDGMSSDLRAEGDYTPERIAHRAAGERACRR